MSVVVGLLSSPLLALAALTSKGRAKASSCIVNESPPVAFRSVSLISRRENCFPCYGRGRLRNQMSRDACRNQRTAEELKLIIPFLFFFSLKSVFSLVNFSLSVRVKRNLIFSAYQLTSINASFASQRRVTIAEMLLRLARYEIGKITGLVKRKRKKKRG